MAEIERWLMFSLLGIILEGRLYRGWSGCNGDPDEIFGGLSIGRKEKYSSQILIPSIRFERKC